MFLVPARRSSWQFGGEILVVPREVLLDGAAEQRLIAGRGDLIVVWQARGIHIGRASHPEGVGPLQQLDEIALIATEIFGDHHSSVVRRLGDHAFNRVLDSDCLTSLQAELTGRLLGRMLGHLEWSVEADPARFEALEQRESVMIFVSEAGWRSASGLEACSTAPLLPSTTIEGDGGEYASA